MIYIGTYLKIIDNSGARFAKCLKIYKKSVSKAGCIGDLILVSVKKVNPSKKIKKGEMFKGIIVRRKKIFYRYGGIFIKFKSSAIILFNKRDGLLGTRILGIVAQELRNFNHFKIVSLAKGVI